MDDCSFRNGPGHGVLHLVESSGHGGALLLLRLLEDGLVVRVQSCPAFGKKESFNKGRLKMVKTREPDGQWGSLTI